MFRPSTFFKILFVCLLFVSCDDEPLEGEFVTSEDVMDDDDSDGDGDDMDNDNPDEQSFLLSQIIGQVEGETESYTVDYNYDSENRLLTEEYSFGLIVTFMYENNQLIGTVSSNGDPSDDIIETYTYDNQGRVASVTIDFDNRVSTENLIYNSDGSIIEGFDSITNDLESRITLSNGNIDRIEQFNSAGELLEFCDFTYDNMNAPLSNIASRDRIVTIFSENLYNIPRYNLNNILTEVYTTLQDDFVETFTYSHTYNDQGYPITTTLVVDDGEDTETFNYTLTYIPVN